MGIFKRGKNKKEEVAKEEVAPPPPPDVLGSQNKVFCTACNRWQWILEKINEEAGNITVLENSSDLPTSIIIASSKTEGETITPTTRRSRRKKPASSCTLRLEVSDSDGRVLEAVHSSSEAFDGLEDKDELVRTMQRCRCEHLELSPPSRLLNWDVTREECMNLVGESLPTLKGSSDGGRIAVLKEPMGTSGTGIFFVKDASEINDIIEQHRKKAVEEPDFLDNLIAAKGRIPSWVLQAEVRPALLIRGRRKFHIRSYVACVEKVYSDDEELVDMRVFNRHEVLIAGESVPESETDTRERSAHITNGGVSKKTERVLLHDEPELTKRDLQAKLEHFIAKVFAEHLIKDIERRVSISANEDDSPINLRKFAIAGLDLMVTEDDKLYLLEVNVQPAAPPPGTVGAGFEDHLTGMMTDLMNLIVGKPSDTFVRCDEILARQT